MDSDIRQLIWDRAKKYYPVKASHGLNHIEDNLNMAEKMLTFAKEPFTDQIYAAIVFHDSGLEKYGREIHEVHSAEIAKRELKDLFNSKDLFLIAAAIKEHRASFKGTFTSMLSDICSSADRNAPNFEASVARSFLYTSEHHPEFSFEEKCETVAKHLNAKYGTNGYARFPIYYSRYYRNDLREYQRKMDALTCDVVAKVVGNNGKNASKIYDASMEEMESIKKITFPPSEIEMIKKQDRIITTRVSADYDKFHEGDLVETPWKAIYKVAKRLEITSIEKHPYYSELTKQQIAYLSKQDKIAVLTLEKQFNKVETNIVDNKVYHASPFKLDKLSGSFTKSWSGEKGSVFVSPFKGLVSCFVINKDDVLKIAQEQLGGRLVGLNFGYDVWNWSIDRLRSIPSKVTILLNVKGLKTFSGESTGYLYTIDYNKYKDKTHMFNKNKNSDVEFLIEGDVQYLKCEKVTVKWECKSSAEEINRKGEAKIVSMEEFATESASTKIWTKDDIKSLDDLKAFYRECQYGIIDFKAGKPWKETHKNTFFKDWEENWKLLSVDQLLKFKCGVCYDTAKANDYFLTKFKVEHVNLFAMTKRDVESADYNDDPTHTFTVYKDEDGKWKWLEASWGTHKNNTLSESSSDKIVRKIGQLLANASGQTNYIGIVQRFPPDGTNMADFYNAMKRYVVHPKWTVKPDSSAMEDLSQEKNGTEQYIDFDIDVDVFQEFNAGIEEFNKWVRDLSLLQLKKDLNDLQVDLVFSQIAQENILVDTVKTIFRKIGEFIAWFFRKLKELWNYFFGKTQRGMRALKSANDLITKHKNSNGFFNDAAFEAAKAPQGLVTAVGLDQFLTTGFSPDMFSSIFNEMLDMWASRPEELYEEVFVKFNQVPTSHKWHYILAYLPTKPGPDGMDGMKYAKTKHPATGSMRESAYDRESVFILLKEAMDAYVAYEKNSKLIAARGNTTVDAARRMIEYQDRTDITEREAVQLAKDIQELGSWMQVVFKSYQSGFEFILQQMNMVTNVYTKYMK